jgi:hypothetical protein
MPLLYLRHHRPVISPLVRGHFGGGLWPVSEQHRRGRVVLDNAKYITFAVKTTSGMGLSRWLHCYLDSTPDIDVASRAHTASRRSFLSPFLILDMGSGFRLATVR